ncbi:MAG TPA: IPT/TIG domain-containing protein [Terriglobales bacterium]|nr:IPT/TIG domain-containing protein [Terriglobales bacterium]
MDDSNPVEFTVTSNPLPPGWLDQDIGQVGAAGTASYANNAFSIQANGSTFFTETADAFHFVYQPLSGDGSIVARVPSTSSYYAQAGLMIRETLSANSNYFMSVNSFSGTAYAMYRVSGGTSGYGGGTSGSLPEWLKVTRSGNTFSGYLSTDGVNWTQLGGSQTISMAQSVYIGLAMSGGTSGTYTGAFDNLTVNSSGAGIYPYISGIAPGSGGVGASVTVSGLYFGSTQGSSTVTFSGTAGTPTSWSANSIVVPVPSGATTGNVLVTKTGLVSNAVSFTVSATPGITNLSPTSGPVSTVVTITGNNFGASQGASSVTFNGTSASPTSWSSTTIVVPVPNGSSSGNVVVTVSGVASNGVSFTVVPAASITSVTPSSGAPGTPVTISGTNFGASQGTSTVTFNGTTSTPTSWSATNIAVAVPGGATTGNVLVSISGVASNGVSFTVLPVPSITSVSPTSGLAGSVVTISGANFGSTQGSGLVTVNGTTAPVTTWSSTSITVSVPLGATTGNIIVFASGVNSNGASFTVENLPSGWTDLDIGPSGATGSAVYMSDVFTIRSAGTGVGSGNSNSTTIDGFHYVYQQLNGDGSVVARLTGASGGWATQGGLMIRETLDQSATNVSFTTDALSAPSLYLFDRASSGGNESYTTTTAIPGYPTWLKLARSGNTFTAFTSPDGINWTQYGAATTVSMAQNAYIGLFSSGGNNGTQIGTATLDNVSLGSSAAPAPAINDVSATTGPIGSQVMLTGSGFGGSQGSSFVTLSSIPVSINSWSDTSINISIPAGATSGHLVVTVAPSMNDSNPVEFTITGNPLPNGWLDQDIGTSGAAGTATFASGVFTLNSAGTGVGGVGGGSVTVDGFHFVYQPLPSDGEIVAHIESIQGGWGSQAGLMIRETLAEGATNAFLTVNSISTPTLYLDYRPSTGGTETYASSSSSALPLWLKLSRSGSALSAYTSPDGLNWTQLGSSISLTMAQNVYIGLACSGGNHESDITTSTFDYVSLTTTTTPAPVIGSLSATTGKAGEQVVLTGFGFGAVQGNSSVNLNGVITPVNSWSDTSITITIPASATSGYLVVTVAPSGNDSNAMPFEVTSNPLPSPWLDQDIGPVGLAGGSSYGSNAFTAQGAGNGWISNQPDGFHFVFQPISGDGTIIARIVSLSGSNSAAGVMFRQAIEDTAAPNAFAYYFGQNTDIYYSDRTTEGSNEGDISYTASLTLPYWAKLVRSGDTFSAFTSADGANWSQVGTTQTIGMSASAYVGLAVSDRTTSTLATAVFDNVSVTSTSAPGPSITGLSSTTGSVGSQVVIYGTGFGASQGNSAVLLSGVATTVDSWAANSITITIPNGAVSGPLLASVAPGMNDSNAVQFTVTSDPLPSGWLDQDIGSVGVEGSAGYSAQTFTVSGGGYGIGGTGYGYGGPQDAFHFVYQPLAGDGTVVARIVTNPGTMGQSGIMIRQGLDAGSLNFFFGNYTVDEGAFIFDRASTGSGETSPAYAAATMPYWIKVQRSGSSFTSYTSADGSSWTQVGSAVSIPMSENVYVGFAVSGGSQTTLGSATFDNVAVSFTAWGASPTISSVTPTSGDFGATVTISGSNFGATQGSSAVTFNGTPAAPCGTCWSSSSITVNVPNGATTGNIVVNVGGVNSNGVTFGVFNPSITGVSPPAAQASAMVTINGSGFGSTFVGNQVQFNGIPGSILSWSDTSIAVQVPSNATSGPVTVIEGGVTSNSVSFSVETLSVTGISPNMALPGSTVVITGTGFGPYQSNSTVDFNGTVASVQDWSDTQITTTVPTGTTSGSVRITVGGFWWFGPLFTVETQTQLVDSQNHQTTYLFAMIGGIWAPIQVQGSGCSTCTIRGNISYTYDGSGNPLSRTDENGNTTTYTYDSFNDLLTVTVPIAPGHTATTAYTYNSFSEVLTATDPLGNVTTNKYDTNGNLLTVTAPTPGDGAAASVTQFAYNNLGELTQITDPLGNQTNITYFSTGMINTITDAQSNVTTYAYDSRGNRTSVTDANNKQTIFTYDAMNRLTKITYPDSTATQFGYDVRGRRTSVTDQNSKQTTYAYDDADRLITVTDAANNVTTYGYDSESNLTSIKDANNNTTTFDYDAFARVTATHFPSGHVEQYSYDNVGNLTGKTDRKNQQITYTYDQLNRLTQKTYPDTTTVNYTYDDDSRLTQVTDPTGTYTFTFDNMGRLSGTTTNVAFLTSRSFVTSYGYDAASNRTTFVDPESGSTSFAYDSLNRLQTLTPPTSISGGSFGFGYDALSRRTSLTRPNSVNTTYTYDNLSRLLSVTHAKAGATLDGASYGLDNAGNRTSKTDLYANLVTNYGYDNIYELLSAAQGSTTTESYTYDPVGNRLSNLSVSGWSNNTSNELTSRPGVTYTYDANGNTTSKTDSTGTTNYSWDFENRLTSVTLPGSGGSVSYAYDPFGRRIYKSSSTGTSIYTYDGINLVEETNASGSVVARYSQGTSFDELLAMLRSGATSYYERDGLGSVTSLSNAAGALTQTYTFDSFGNTTNSSGSLTNPFQYTSREFDTETTLYYMRARYFDPKTGRFLSEDPLGFSVGDNFYAYSLNSPVNFVDPAGLSPFDLYNLYEKARKKLKKADCVVSAALCQVGEQVSALNSMSNDAITNTAEAQQNQGNPNAGDLGMQRVQLCLAADQNCKNALEKCIKLAVTNPFPPPSWLTDLMNYFSKNPSAPAPPIKRE